MKILHITTQKPNSTGSGIYLSEIISQAAKENASQALVAGVDAKDSAHFPAGCDFYPVSFNTAKLPFNVVGMSDSMPYPATKYSELTPVMAEKLEEAFLEVISKVVENLDPDIIICHHLYLLTSIVREKFPERKILAISHGSDLRQFQKTHLQRERIKRNIQNLDGIFALHIAQRDDIARIFDIPETKISILGTGYNDEIFYDQKINRDSDLIKLIFAGKISHKKGVYSLLKSLNSIVRCTNKPFKLYLAGGHSDREEYEEIMDLSGSLNFDHEFIGKITQIELAEWFNKCHIMVLPSFFEGLPLVIIEALACKCGVVSTNLPGVQQWICENIPTNNVVFVEPPEMENIDHPVKSSLKAFEENLARALKHEIDNYKPADINLSHVTWEKVYKRLINAVK